MDNGDEIYKRFVLVTFSDPLQEMRCNLMISDCSFPEAGQYQVFLLAEDELLGQRSPVLVEKENL